MLFCMPTFCCMASTFSCLAFSFGCMWLSTWPLLFPCTPFFSCLCPHGLYFSSLHFTLVCCMIQSFVRPCPTSSDSRFHFACQSVPILVCLTVPIPVLLAGRFRFCLPAGSDFAYRPVSGLHTDRFPDCIPPVSRLHTTSSHIAYQPVSKFAYRTHFPDLLIGQFPILGNLATIIHQDKVAKVLLAQEENERFLCAYIARALICLSMWDKS